MPFQKGKIANPSGRPKGIKGVKTEQWEIFRDYYINQGLIRFQEEMNKLEGRDYVEVSVKLLEYFKPKLARTEITGEDGGKIEIKVDI